MASIFTEHVRHFSSDSDRAERVLPELERLLKQRMRRKNLLSAPPAFLGYDEVPSWDAAHAFEDIVADCYHYAVLKRLKGLRRQLCDRDNIDGLIVLNVDQFLLERQRRRDPIGYTVFSNVEGAVNTAIATGELRIDRTTNRGLHSASLLRLDPTRPEVGPADRDAVRAVLTQVHDWNEVLSKLTSATEDGQQWLATFFGRLRASGIAAVICGDLVAVLATQARADVAARHAVHDQELAYEGAEDFGAIVQMVWPDRGFEDRDRWEDLKRRIAERIAGLDRQQRVRDRLAAVFATLVEAIEEGGPAPPTQAGLTELLDVPRATISDDFRLLRELIGELIAGNPEG